VGCRIIRMIPDIRATVDELSQGVDNTSAGELMLFETWLRGNIWQRRPDLGGGITIDRNMERAAQAFASLMPAYRRKDWDAIKQHARTAHEALT
jgi:hypothetical protein